MPEVRITLNGAPRLLTQDGRWHALERHDAALLALLALEGRVTRARVAELLWPDRPLQRSRNSLRQRLFKLRRTAGLDLIEGDDWLSLADGVRSDWLLPDDPATLPPEGGAAELLGNGRYDDLVAFDEWLARARERWRAAHQAAYERMADTLEHQGRFDAALAWATRVLAADGLNEVAHRRVIRLHYLAGDRPAALAAFRRSQATLAQELGVEPDRETTDLARLVERSAPPMPAAGSALPAALIRTPALVGREPAWRTLAQAWAQGRVVLLGGEAGIGKSRLARDFAQAHPATVRVGAVPGDAAQPYATLGRLLCALRARWGDHFRDANIAPELARLAPEFGPVTTAGSTPDALQRAIVAALTHWLTQGLQGLVIDDLHFADTASAEALASWLREPAAQHLPHLLIARTGAWPAAWAAWRDAGAGADALVLDLPALDTAGLAALLNSLDMPGVDTALWTERLMRHTGGNPLFVLETLVACHQAGGLQAIADNDEPLPAPEGVARLIEQRLRGLSPGALRLARMLAIGGSDCGPELVAAALGRDVVELIDDWRELKDRQVAGDAGFTHDLVQAAVLRAIPLEIASVMHGRIGQALLASGQAPGRTAGHLREARQWAAAAAQWLRAAELAATQSRHDEEIEWLRAAVDDATRAGDLHGAFATRVRRAERMLMTGSLSAALAEIEQLRPAAKRPMDQLPLHLLAAKACLAGADTAGAEDTARAALALAEQLQDADAQFRANQLLASALAASGQAAQALARLESMVTAAAARTDARERCGYHGSLGYVLAVSGRRREAVEHLGLAAELAHELGEDAEAMTLWSNLAGTLSMMGRVAEAAQTAQRARQLSVHAGPKQGIAVASNETMLGLALSALGQFAEAEAVLQDALRRFAEAGGAIWIYATEGMLANLYIMLGQAARARRLLAGPAPVMPDARRARRLVVQARLARAAGRDGLPELSAALALIEGSAQRSMDRIGVTLAWAQAAPAEAALARLQDVQAVCLDQQLDGMALTARVREVDVRRRLGQHELASAGAREAMAQAEACHPHDLYLAEFWWLLFQAFNEAGQRGEAEAALGRAADWVRAALPQVPEAYRDAFVHRQAINVQILAAAAQRLGAVDR